MRSRLKTLVVSPFGAVGGAEIWLLRLLGATDELDVRVILLAEGPLRQELETRGIRPVVRLTGRHAHNIIGAAIWLLRRLRRAPPDVVLANGVKAAAAAVPAARLARIPVVWMKHDYSFDRSLARPLARLSTRVGAAARELGAPTGRPDVVVIPPPRPDTPPADSDAARRYWRRRGLDLNGPPTLVMLTRLVPFKGVDDAIRALARVESWRLVVVGPDDPAAPGERQRLESLARGLEVQDRVQILEPVSEAAHWLAAFDAMAVLTRAEGPYGREGFGISGIEAMLAGLPVIVTGPGALARRLAGRAGVEVPPSDPEAVAEALRALTPPEARRRAGRAGRELVADHPDAAACARLLAELLRDAATA